MRGKVVRVTPQRSHASPGNRGCRVDVETETGANEFYRYEIEIAPNALIMVRDLFSASHFFVEKSAKGDTHSQMAVKMPKVIYINILGHNIRKTNKDMVQPVKFMYTKEPKETAVDKISIYNIQLPRILDMKQDFDDDLFCWCYTLYTAHTEHKAVKEVISMNQALQAYATRDTGFRQFCERHETVSADPQTRRDYVSWFSDMLREEGRIEAVRQEYMLREEGRIEAVRQEYELREEGKIEAVRQEYEPRLAEAEHNLAEAEQKLLASARNMKNEGIPIEVIAKAFSLSKDEVINL
jgi:hypothetical protein